MEPTRRLSRAIMSPRRAAHLARYADNTRYADGTMEADQNVGPAAGSSLRDVASLRERVRQLASITTVGILMRADPGRKSAAGYRRSDDRQTPRLVGRRKRWSMARPPTTGQDTMGV